MTNSHLRLVAPITEDCTVAPRRPKNAELRTREHLTPDEVEQLMDALRGLNLCRRGIRQCVVAIISDSLGSGRGHQ